MFRKESTPIFAGASKPLSLAAGSRINKNDRSKITAPTGRCYFIRGPCMSFQAMTWAVERKLPALQKLVLLMLANRTNHETGVCIPRIKTLAEECGMSETACKNAIKGLEAANCIRIEQRFQDGMQRPSQYHLLIDARRETPTARRDTPTTVRRQTPTVGRETPTEPGRLNNITNHKDDAPKRVPIERLIEDGVSPETAKDFLAHRKTKNAPLTERAWSGIKAEAAKAGWNLEQALDKTIKRNWIAFEAAWVAKEIQAAGGQLQANDSEWHESASGWEGKGQEVGVKRKPGEDFLWFKCRVAKAAEARKQMDMILADMLRTKNRHYAQVYEFFNGNPPMENAA